jgi:hypothetical protein
VHSGDVGQAGDGQDRGEQRAGDEPDARGVREQGVNAGAVQVGDAGQVDDELAAAGTARPSASLNLSALLMSISPTAVTT